MKHIIFGILLFVSIVSVYLIFFSGTSIVNYPTKSGSIIAFGDSLVAGVGAKYNEDFVSLLSLKIGEPILNFGIAGNTTQDGLLRVDAMLEEKPRIVILLLGGNDFIRKIPKQETFSNLKQLIVKIQKSGAVVVLLGVRGGVLVDGYNSDFKTLSKETGSVYVEDVLDGIFGKTALMNHSVHPNNEGYKIIAEKVYQEMKSVL